MLDFIQDINSDILNDILIFISKNIKTHKEKLLIASIKVLSKSLDNYYIKNNEKYVNALIDIFI